MAEVYFFRVVDGAHRPSPGAWKKPMNVYGR
jgi:hypothetical protein